MTSHNVEELAAQVQLLSSQVEELHRRLDQTSGVPGSAGAEDGEPKLVFNTVEQWVTGLFIPMFTWRVDGQR